MSENNQKLPQFKSVKEIVAFFEAQDMGEYDLPEVQFNVDLQKHAFLVAVDE